MAPYSWTGADQASQNLQLALIYVGIELGVSRELVEHDGRTYTVAELAEKSNASSELLDM